MAEDARNRLRELQQRAQGVAPAAASSVNATEQLSRFRNRARAAEEDEGLLRSLGNVVTSFGAGANQGIANVLGFPVDTVNSLLGLAGVPVADEPLGGSSSIRRGFEALGASTTPGQGSLSERVAGRVGEEIGAATVPGAIVGRAASLLGPSLERGARSVRGFIEPILSGARNAPGRFAASELGVSTGAGLGAAAAQEIAPGSQGAEITGQIVGGFAPTAVLDASRSAGQSVFGQIRALTGAGAREEAARRIQGAAVDPALAREGIRQRAEAFPTEATPTSAQLTGDSGLLALERSIIRSAADLKGEFDAAVTATNQALRREIDEIGQLGGDVETAQRFLQDRVARLTGMIDTRAEIAVANARRLVDQARPSIDRRQANLIARQQLEKAMRDVERQEDDLWRVARLSTPVETAPLKAQARAILRSRRKADDPKNIPSDIIKIIDPSGKRKGKRAFKASEQAQQIQALRSRILGEIRKERGGPTPNRRRISNLMQLQESALEVLSGVPGVDSALNFSRRFNEAFRKGPIGRVLGTDTTGEARVPDLLTLEQLVQGGPRGAINATRLLDAAGMARNTDVRSQLRVGIRDFVLNRFLEGATDQSGRVVPSAAERFVRNNQELLQNFPEIRQTVSDARSAQEFADTMTQSGRRLRRNLQNARESRAQLFIGQNPEKAWSRILSSPRPAEVTRQLISQLSKDPTGEALAGFKSGFVKNMLGRSELRVLDEAGDRRVFGRELTKFLKENEPLMRSTGLFSNDEIGRMRRVAEAASLVDKSFTSGLPGGSDTVQNASVLLEAMGAIAGARLGAQVGTTPLISAGIGRRLAKSIVGEMPEEAVRRLIRQAIFDPDLMDDLLEPVTQSNAKEIRRRLRGSLLNLGGGEEE